MKIECFFAESCGSKDQLKENIGKALFAEGMTAEISFRVLSQEKAEQLGIGGSPTVWINGQDIEPGILLTGIS